MRFAHSDEMGVNTIEQPHLLEYVYIVQFHIILYYLVYVVLVSLMVKAGDSVLHWPEGLGFDSRAGQSVWCGVRGLYLTTH